MYEVFANAGILLGGYTFSESSEISVARLLRFRDCVATLPPCKYVCDFFPCKLVCGILLQNCRRVQKIFQTFTGFFNLQINWPVVRLNVR